MKVAVTDIFLVIVKEAGLAEPDKSPLQLLKLQPLAVGIAVKLTMVPETYIAWSGLLVTEPEPTVPTVNAYGPRKAATPGFPYRSEAAMPIVSTGAGALIVHVLVPADVALT